MNNRSIAWWLRQIELPQYTKTLESEYYGLEGLMHVTDGELKDAGIEDAAHRETILSQLSRDRQKLDPLSDYQVVKRRVSRKYSLGSSSDLPKDLFRQSVLPRLHRADKKHRLSSSCSLLHPLDEDNALSHEGKHRRLYLIACHVAVFTSHYFEDYEKAATSQEEERGGRERKEELAKNVWELVRLWAGRIVPGVQGGTRGERPTEHYM
ncbi:uncharacterized protein LOC118560582 [Fundulus heteroclitus]|uniref:uncharacterized protein LOC118560582 n=1 Tax=Fundulus heteroclitus TaxID=8078 RepID=UPI00165B406C|nr:uncharacterized protein LOC118560582 [Fundulus heteroclitus]